MFRNFLIIIALVLNFLICSLYSIPMGINDYQSGSFGLTVKTWGTFWPLALPSFAALLSLIGLFKIRLATILSFLLSLCFYGVMIYAIVSLSFQESERGRNGGAIPTIIIFAAFLLINLCALFILIKTWALNKNKVKTS